MGDIQIILGNGVYSLALLFLVGLPLVAAPIVYFAGRFFKVARWPHSSRSGWRGSRL